MARHTQDREDLLRDATALVPRLFLRAQFSKGSCDVFVGFRPVSAVSIYFDGDPVYHFNTERKLRRAFVNDQNIKADDGWLVVWEPQRTAETVTMHGRTLSAIEQQEFGATVLSRIGKLREALWAGRFELLGQVPADGNAISLLLAWLREMQEFEVADTAGVS